MTARQTNENKNVDRLDELRADSFVFSVLCKRGLACAVVCSACGPDHTDLASGPDSVGWSYLLPTYLPKTPFFDTGGTSRATTFIATAYVVASGRTCTCDMHESPALQARARAPRASSLTSS